MANQRVWKNISFGTVGPLRYAELKSSERSRSAAKHLSTVTLVLLCMFFSAFRSNAQEQRKDLGEFNLTLVGDNNIVTLATVRQNKSLETTFPGPDAYPAGAPRSENIFSDPALLKELQWIGFNLFGTANNHSMDFGIQGLLDTIQVLKQGGAVYAGTGIDLGHARAPGYLSTAHGRVALVTCASTFPQDSPAGQARPDIRGRPGLSPLHYDVRYLVRCPLSRKRRRVRSSSKAQRRSNPNGR
jgi:hypothetical protein